MPIKKGDTVKIEYEGTLDDGTIFDSSEKGGEPLEFEVGAGQIIPGFENEVIGMEEGDEKEFKLQPHDAYGDHNPQLVQKIPMDQMPVGVTAGIILVVGLPNGLQIPARVTEVTEEWATIDLNHPLAGQVLNFKIKIVDVTS
jgi:peptidylprolyl isomerase